MKKLSRTELLKNVPYPLRIEIIENEFRIDLSESDKADLAERIRPYLKDQTKPGRRTDLEKSTSGKHLPEVAPERVNEKIGKILKESKETVRKRDKVFESVDEDMKNDLNSGAKSLHSAYQQTVARQNATKKIPPLPSGKFNHIVEDPGWDFANKNIGGSGESGASYKYRTQPTAKIARIPILDIAADDAILYMWTTNQHLITGSMLASEYHAILEDNRLKQTKTKSESKINKLKVEIREKKRLLKDTLGKQKVQSDALSVMHCHGFAPKYIITWEKEGKEGWGGYGFNNVTEHLLIGVRGKVAAFGLSEKTIVKTKYRRNSHSEKPDAMWHLIEKCAKTQRWKGRKLELNCRTPRRGWHPHGDQIAANDIAEWKKLR